MTTRQEFLEYNATDSACTLECHNAFWHDLTPDYTKAYELTISLLPILSFMQTRGIRVDSEELAKTSKEIVALTEEKQRELNDICGRPLNVNSSKDCQKYFYIEKGIPPYYNEGSITTDDLALQRIARGTARRAGLREAKLVQEVRGLQKLHSTYLSMEFDKDGRFRSSYNPRGSKFGRLSSSKTIFGTGGNCLTPDTEVLTKDGWVQLQFLQDEEILQWRPDGSLEWTIPTVIVSECTDGMLLCQTEQFQGQFTRNHRIPGYSLGALSLTVNTAEATSNMQRQIPISGRIVGGASLENLIRVIAMVQADGSVDGKNIRLSFSKERKIERCIQILTESCIDFTEQACSPGFRRFCISVKDSAGIISLIGKAKNFGPWILDLSYDTILNFIEEVGFWDSHIRGQSYQYCTTNWNNAQWVATAAHLCGRSATVRHTGNGYRGGYGSEDNKPQYTVNVKPRDRIYIEPKHWEMIDYTGPVYCLSVESTFFLCRFRNFISVTGNSQNLDPAFKRFLVPDPGYFFWEIDKRQAEWVVVAYLTGDANMISIVESGKDTHLHTGSLVLSAATQIPYDDCWALLEYEGKLIGHNSDPALIAELRASDPLVARFARFLPRSMSGRQKSKKMNHGLNYDEGYKKYSLINELEESEGKRDVALYHMIYPGIRVWYETIKRQLQKDRSLTNYFGRKVRFMDAWGDELFKAAYSMLPQSTVVDSLNIGMVEMYNEPWLCGRYYCNIDILAQVHDSILMQVPIEYGLMPERFQKAMSIVYDAVSPPITYNGRTFKIATDSKVGLNWGGFNKERNPLGMRDLKRVEDLPGILNSWTGN